MSNSEAGASGPREIHSDFLIIGSGLAGLYAALYASNFGSVTILTKSTVEESNSFWAQGGIAAAVDPEDSTWFHIEDTIRAGRGLNNTEAVQVLVNEGRDLVMDLINLGMKFDSGERGLELGLEGGHTKRRVLHAGGSSTGREMVKFLIAAVEDNPSIKKHESTGVVELISDDARCYGALALGLDFEPVAFISKSAILATGGASALYERTTNPGGATGEGIALAYQAGAEITDMEFVQFHPTAFYNEHGASFLITEAVRGEGAYLLDVSGQRFMKMYSELGELAPRDIVSRAVYLEMAKSSGQYVYLDMRHLDSEFVKSRFPNIYELCLNYGIDITKNLIPVAPAAHYTIGGVRTGLLGQTNIKGLFACGEVACTGVHGANRLASNSLLECVVFAKRAVDGALESSGKESLRFNNKFDLTKFTISKAEENLFSEYKTACSRILNRFVGIVRDRDGLTEAEKELKTLYGYSARLSGYYGLKLNMILEVSSIITRFSLIREESRGAHIRQDYPDEEPRWRKHTVMKKGEEPETVPV